VTSSAISQNAPTPWCATSLTLSALSNLRAVDSPRVATFLSIWAHTSLSSPVDWLETESCGFFLKIPPAASRSIYRMKPTWLGQPSTLLSTRTPRIDRPNTVEVNRTFVFHQFLETTALAMVNLACVQDTPDRERKIWGHYAWYQIEGGHLVDS
jgi:hypothetical protein